MKFRNQSLPVAERVEDLIGQLTLQEKAGLLVMHNSAIERLGVGSYHWWNEALHGLARAGEATVFPQAIGLAAAWSPELMRHVAEIAATESRAKNNEEVATHNGDSRCYYGNTIWSPNINIFRDPRWGRGQETYGEDPFLTGSLGVAFVQGLQGDDPRYLKTVATLKHFAVHSGPEPLRHKFDARVSEKDLRDTYLPAFEEGIRYGEAQSVMSAYNAFNGCPCVSSSRLLTAVLRDEWGFQGAVVGDVDNVVDLYSSTGHACCKGGPEAVSAAIKAGNDLRSGGNPEHVVEAVEQGLLTEADIHQALKRLLTLRFKLGHFDPPSIVPWSEVTTEAIRSPEHQQAAYEASRQSLVLLKNDGVLPLNPARLRKVAVLGPTADDRDVLEGNYAGTPRAPVTILDGLRRKLEPAGVEVLAETYLPFAEGHYTLGVPIPPGVFFADAAATTPGLLCRMYNSGEPEGEPVLERIERMPALEWNAALPRPPQLTVPNASVVWSGYMNLKSAGRYMFYLHLRGKASLQIGNLEPFNGTAFMAIFTRTQAIEIPETGLVPVKLIFRQVNELGYFAMEWEPADGGAAVEAAYERAWAAAKAADLVILTLGLSHKLEGEEMTHRVAGFLGGDRTTIELPPPQKRLLDGVARLGKPVVLLLSSGSAVTFDPGKVNAALQTWYYGQQGGLAIADALFGVFSPAGRLPMTFYRQDADLPPFEDYAMKGRTYRYFEGTPLFAFGHGLTYTTFEYSNLVVQPISEGLKAKLKITNTGSFTSDEVVQVYASRSQRQAGDPLRWLAGYQRVYALAPGESREVTIEIPNRWLALWSDGHQKRVVQPGEMALSAGAASDRLFLQTKIAMPEV